MRRSPQLHARFRRERPATSSPPRHYRSSSRGAATRDFFPPPHLRKKRVGTPQRRNPRDLACMHTCIYIYLYTHTREKPQLTGVVRPALSLSSPLIYSEREREREGRTATRLAFLKQRSSLSPIVRGARGPAHLNHKSLSGCPARSCFGTTFEDVYVCVCERVEERVFVLHGRGVLITAYGMCISRAELAGLSSAREGEKGGRKLRAEKLTSLPRYICMRSCQEELNKLSCS